MDRTKAWKIVQTLWLFWGFMMPGVGDAVLGPTLLDLKLLVDEPVVMFSYLILTTGIGAVIGSLLAGFIFLRVNTKLKLAIAVLLGSLINSITAAVPNYAYFVVMFGLQGLCRGFIACYLLEVCNKLWEHKGTAFQFLFCGATTGSILTPLIVRPFLCVPANLDRQSLWGSNNRSHTDCQASDTHVQHAYILLGILTMPSGLAFVYYWVTSRNASETESEQEYQNLGLERTSTKIVKSKLQYLYLVVQFCFYFPMLGNIVLYNTFLTAFGVDGPLHMSKNNMIYMTSLLWGGFLLSRVGNTLLTPCCGNFKIILVNLVCLLMTGAVLISLAGRYEAALWTCTIAIGLFSGPYQGAALAMTGEFMKIDAKVISVTVLGVGTGSTALPFLGGLLYEHAPPMGHLYLIFSLMIFMCLMFLLLNYVGVRVKKAAAILGDEVKLEETNTIESP